MVGKTEDKGWEYTKLDGIDTTGREDTILDMDDIGHGQKTKVGKTRKRPGTGHG